MGDSWYLSRTINKLLEEYGAENIRWALDKYVEEHSIENLESVAKTKRLYVGRCFRHNDLYFKVVSENGSSIEDVTALCFSIRKEEEKYQFVPDKNHPEKDYFSNPSILDDISYMNITIPFDSNDWEGEVKEISNEEFEKEAHKFLDYMMTREYSRYHLTPRHLKANAF